ncbi:MAG: prenyltransferase [Gammaproteobacteria bacterium]|nr:MAG: prenyltransferase [Gammaproteobacteria bacterium]
MEHAEPTPAALTNPVARYFLATRPPFLSVTLFAALIGLGAATYDRQFHSLAAAFVTVLFALVAHAGINVLNDYYDALNGTDALNTERIFPYTGGSRFIQNGVLSLAETGWFGALLMTVVVPAGLWLTFVSGQGLLAIGLAGLVIGWAYSAPPLRLNSRGFGELCVAAGFALIVIGADYVQRRGFGATALAASVSYALLVTNILYINQFPDRAADAAAGKRHWVVRLPPLQGRWGYALIAFIAYGWLIAAVLAGWLPAAALFALLSAPLSFAAARDLLKYAEQPRQLAPAIRRTIAAASVHGGLLATALYFGRVV